MRGEGEGEGGPSPCQPICQRSKLCSHGQLDWRLAGRRASVLTLTLPSIIPLLVTQSSHT